MTLRTHFYFWAGTFLAFLAFIYVFKGVLLPFVLGIAIAYLLNPLVNAMGRVKISRSISAVLILGIFYLVIGAIIAVLSPLLYRQAVEFADDLPGYIESASNYAEPYIQKALAFLGEENTEDIKTAISSQSGTAADVAKNLLEKMIAGGAALFDVFSVLVLTPIVAYFMMKEWPGITKWAEDLLPQEHKNTILKLFKEIDEKLSGFVRGQISVAVILGVGYAIALTLAGLKYGFLIGLMSGLLSVIPMVGSALGLLVSVIVAWFQAGDLVYVAIIAAIFLAGQLIEGNILSPKIVGDSVGLHPLWIFFALLAGGSLFGILGMLLAVPVAAVAGVLLAFALTQYKASSYFKGKAKPKKKPSSPKKKTKA